MAFRTMPGVEHELIPEGWIANHYRLIAWKLAGYERFISEQLKGCLSIENIVQQLKYRYYTQFQLDLINSNWRFKI